MSQKIIVLAVALVTVLVVTILTLTLLHNIALYRLVKPHEAKLTNGTVKAQYNVTRSHSQVKGYNRTSSFREEKDRVNITHIPELKVLLTRNRNITFEATYSLNFTFTLPFAALENTTIVIKLIGNFTIGSANSTRIYSYGKARIIMSKNGEAFLILYYKTLQLALKYMNETYAKLCVNATLASDTMFKRKLRFCKVANKSELSKFGISSIKDVVSIDVRFVHNVTFLEVERFGDRIVYCYRYDVYIPSSYVQSITRYVSTPIYVKGRVHKICVDYWGIVYSVNATLHVYAGTGKRQVTILHIYARALRVRHNFFNEELWNRLMSLPLVYEYVTTPIVFV